MRFKKGSYGKMHGHAFEGNAGGQHFSPETFQSGSEYIAWRFGQQLFKIVLEVMQSHVVCITDGPEGILQDLIGFYARNFIKKPPATGVHENGMPLHFHKSQHGSALIVGQRAAGMFVQKIADGRLTVPTEQYFEVFISGHPGVFEQAGTFPLKQGREAIAQEIEGIAQRAAPLLVPAGMPGVVTAIAAPALYTVYAAPGRVFVNRHLPFGREQFKKLPVIGEGGNALVLDIIEGIGKGHFSKPVVMSVTFSIGSDMGQLGLIRGCIENLCDTVGKAFPVIEQSLESYRLRNASVVKKQGNAPPAGQQTPIWLSGVNALGMYRFPCV